MGPRQIHSVCTSSKIPKPTMLKQRVAYIAIMLNACMLLKMTIVSNKKKYFQSCTQEYRIAKKIKNGGNKLQILKEQIIYYNIAFPYLVTLTPMK